jgi:hypothetical protein
VGGQVVDRGARDIRQPRQRGQRGLGEVDVLGGGWGGQERRRSRQLGDAARAAHAVQQALFAESAVRGGHRRPAQAEPFGEVALGGQAGVDRDAAVEHEQADALRECAVGAASVAAPVAEEDLEGAGAEGGFHGAGHFSRIGFL